MTADTALRLAQLIHDDAAVLDVHAVASRRATASMHSERFVGFFLSRQVTAFQLNHIASLADPFFGLGTQRVLTSHVSRAFPIPDAGLGAVA